MSVVPAATEVLAGLTFAEGLRFRDGELWLSDMYAGRVVRIDAAGAPHTVAMVGEHVSGLGFLPDGTPLVVAMESRRVLRIESDGSTSVYADLSDIATWHANDMHVDATGRAWVGNFGDDSAPPAPPHPAVLAAVDPDGSVVAAAGDMLFANGIVTVDDGATLLVAETRAVPGRITAFDIVADGALCGRRVFADTGRAMPDGLAVDDTGRVWFAGPFTSEVVRLTSAGEVDVRVPCPPMPFSVAWGAGRLYVAVSARWEPEDCLRARDARVIAFEF